MCNRNGSTGLKTIVLLATLACSAAVATTARAAEPLALSDVSERAWEMASEGRYSDVLEQVKLLTNDAGDEELAALHREIVAHETHEQDRTERMASLYQEKVQQLHEQLEEDKLREALGSAVEAHGLSTNPDELMASEEVQRLVKLAEAEATERQQDGQWLRALSLYRGLELLFDNEERYTERLKRVARHVALLRLYAPQHLQDLYIQDAEERGEEEPNLWNVEENAWENRLRGVKAVMLNESLHFGARQHVEGSNFEELLIGGIDGLKVFFSTKGMETTFPNLADETKTEPFLDYLDQLRISIAQRDVPMSYAEAAQIVNRLMDRNEATVELPEAVIVHELGDGAMTSLDDFSSVIWPHQKQRFERTTRGAFSGVGIQITLVNRELTVVTPLEDTPAHQAGVRPGDKVTSIDGTSTLGMELDQAVERITGKEGTKVLLGIQSPTDEEPREVELVRSNIRIVSVKGWERDGSDWNFYVDPALKLGYARVTTFGPETAEELDAAVQSMKDAGGVNGLIIDLRFNPGGRLDAAVDITNRFLNAGTIVSTSQQLLAGGNWEASASREHTLGDFPVIVLINKGSASASEIVAGALQAHKRALVVGENSFGKGSVQNLFRIGGDQGYLKLTTQYYRLPDGRIIHRRPGAEKWGIHPDVTVRVTEQQTAEVLEARMLLDVLREDGEAIDPEAIMARRNDEDDDAAEDRPVVTKADDILKFGLDPQLETALILLKTRLLSDIVHASK